jgi:hypothetical protein
MRTLSEIADKLAKRYQKEELNREQDLTWIRTVALKEKEEEAGKKGAEIKIPITFRRPIETFTVPGAGEPVEVFIEPGGDKVCTLCQRCIFARHSPPQKDAFKIRLTAPPTAAEVPASTAETRKKTRRRRKAVAA